MPATWPLTTLPPGMLLSGCLKGFACPGRGIVTAAIEHEADSTYRIESWNTASARRRGWRRSPDEGRPNRGAEEPRGTPISRGGASGGQPCQTLKLASSLARWVARRAGQAHGGRDHPVNGRGIPERAISVHRVIGSLGRLPVPTRQTGLGHRVAPDQRRRGSQDGPCPESTSWRFEVAW